MIGTNCEGVCQHRHIDTAHCLSAKNLGAAFLKSKGASDMYEL